MDRHGLHVRIDNRLLHGQVVQFWIPYLEIDHLIIADDTAAASPAMASVYRMAVPDRIALTVIEVTRLAAILERNKSTSSLVILSDIFDIARARMSGFDFRRVTIGNIHSARGRDRITDAVYLTPEEVAGLVSLRREDKKIEIQTFPGESLQLTLDDNGGPLWSKS